jgi:hypothetical protein
MIDTAASPVGFKTSELALDDARAAGAKFTAGYHCRSRRNKSHGFLYPIYVVHIHQYGSTSLGEGIPSIGKWSDVLERERNCILMRDPLRSRPPPPPQPVNMLQISNPPHKNIAHFE